MRDAIQNPITKAMKSLLEGMCEFPKSLEIVEVETDDTLMIQILPHTADTPLIVGKGGAGVRALEWLGERAGKLAGKRCLVALDNSFEGRTQNGSQPFSYNSQFDVDALKRLLNTWTTLVFSGPVGMTMETKHNQLKIYLDPHNGEAEDPATIRALAQVFYPYAFRSGGIVKIRPVETVKTD